MLPAPGWCLAQGSKRISVGEHRQYPNNVPSHLDMFRDLDIYPPKDHEFSNACAGPKHRWYVLSTLSVPRASPCNCSK